MGSGLRGSCIRHVLFLLCHPVASSFLSRPMEAVWSILTDQLGRNWAGLAQGRQARSHMFSSALHQSWYFSGQIFCALMALMGPLSLRRYSQISLAQSGCSARAIEFPHGAASLAKCQGWFSPCTRMTFRPFARSCISFTYFEHEISSLLLRTFLQRGS